MQRCLLIICTTAFIVASKENVSSTIKTISSTKELIICDSSTNNDCTQETACCHVSEAEAIWRGIYTNHKLFYGSSSDEVYIKVGCSRIVPCLNDILIELKCKKDAIEGLPYLINDCYQKLDKCYMTNWLLANKAIVPIEATNQYGNATIIKREFDKDEKFEFACKLGYEYRSSGTVKNSIQLTCGKNYEFEGGACTSVKCSVSDMNKPYMHAVNNNDLLNIDMETLYQCKLSDRRVSYICLFNGKMNIVYMLPKDKHCEESCKLNSGTSLLEIISYIVTIFVIVNILLLLLLYCGKIHKIIINGHLAYSPEYLTLREYFLEKRCKPKTSSDSSLQTEK